MAFMSALRFHQLLLQLQPNFDITVLEALVTIEAIQVPIVQVEEEGTATDAREVEEATKVKDATKIASVVSIKVVEETIAQVIEVPSNDAMSQEVEDVQS